jgi:signal transduction histidine kinase
VAPRDIAQQLAEEKASRQAAEQLLERKTTELYEIMQTVRHRIQVVAEKSAALTACEVQIDQLLLRLMLSEKAVAIGRLASGIADQLGAPLHFITDGLNGLKTYLADVRLVLNEQKHGIESHKYLGFFKTPAHRKVAKTHKKSDFEFVLRDVDNLLADFAGTAYRVEKMLADMRDFSQVEAVDMAKANINDLLDRTLDLAASELSYRAEIVKQYGSVPDLKCDSGQLVHVFLNLLLNAAEAVVSKGTITLRTGVHSSMLWVDIADTGLGIPESDLGKIFDPFFTTKAPGFGSGLGLHQVKTVVEAHHGRTTVMS